MKHPPSSSLLLLSLLGDGNGLDASELEEPEAMEPELDEASELDDGLDNTSELEEDGASELELGGGSELDGGLDGTPELGDGLDGAVELGLDGV